MKAYGLLAMIYGLGRKSDRDYVTRAELLKWMKVSPKKARSLDIRLRKLVRAGWLEQGDARGRYVITVLARDFILQMGEFFNRISPYFETEKLPTQQVVLKAEIPYVEYMKGENVFSIIERLLARKDFEMTRRGKQRIALRKIRELKIAFVEALIEPGKITIRATSGPGHLLKAFLLSSRFLTLPEKEEITEFEILRSISLTSFLQIYDAITEALFGDVEVLPLKAGIRSIEKTNKPEFYVFKKSYESRDDAIG